MKFVRKFFGKEANQLISLFNIFPDSPVYGELEGRSIVLRTYMVEGRDVVEMWIE